MKRITHLTTLFIWGLLSCLIVHAQENTGSKLHVYRFKDGATIRGMSDNGLWATAYGPSAADDALWDYARLINITTDEVTLLVPENEAVNGCAANDVSDDGTLVVGSYNGAPAVWMKDGGWVNLPMPAGWSSGEVRAITPDGKYAVGNCILSYTEIPVLWDLSAGGVIVDTPDFPQKDMSGTDNGQTRFIAISPNGKHILGCVSYSYPGDRFYFLYDVATHHWKPIAFDFDAASGKWTSLATHLFFIETACASPNFKWIAGTAYMVEPIEGSAFGNEYVAPFIYDVENDRFTLMKEDISHNMAVSAVGNDGTLFGATPFKTPVRTLYVRKEAYWVPISEIMSQLYNMNYYSLSGFENTGTAIAISSCGNVLSAIAYPNEENYVLEISQTFAEGLSNINLLKEFTSFPSEGADFSKIKKMSVTFDRKVDVVGTQECVSILDENGNIVRSSVSFSTNATDANTIDIQFRSTTLEAGKKYQVCIPKGAICIKGDPSHCNEEINIGYTGRDNIPISITNVSPANGNTLSQISYSTNPVIVSFDTNIALTDSATATLYQEGKFLADLSLAISDNKLAIYTATTCYLHKDASYSIEVKRGTVTDILGNNPNETITLDYIGSYVREVVSNDTIIFSNDFNDGLYGMLLYDGDMLTPGKEMAEWKFTSDLAWHHACDDDNYTDQCATSHSMYETPGRSNDWMVIPVCYIPDEKCYLKFQSQSYKKNAVDSLKIMVLATDEVINVLTDAHIKRFQKEGVVIYHEKELPGYNENYLAGDWKQNSLSLSQFAGKNIYVAFINENTNASAIFINNLQISREIKYSILLNTPSTVVKQSEQAIQGRILIKGEDTFNNIHMKLMGSDGSLVSEIKEEGINLSENEYYEFLFTHPLPLSAGNTTHYTVWASLDGERDSFLSKINNLTFEPYKRVCVESYTGMDCPNCPLGIVTMQHLEKVFGDRIIPIKYHTYTGDFLESGLTDYTNFLGLHLAPSAIINRNGTAISPMKKTSFNGKSDYTFHSNDGSTWLNAVEKELENETHADIMVQATYNADSKSIETVCSYKFAMNMTQQNISLLLIVTEDKLPGYQSSNVYEEADSDLGEWGAEGKYAAGTSLYTFDNVARSVVGNSNIGTGGLVPSEITAEKEYTSSIEFNLPTTVTDIHNCHVVCMMIDANTGAFINAAVCPIIDPNWSSIRDANDEKEFVVQATENGIQVMSDASISVKVYALNGVLIGAQQGVGTVTLPVSDDHGIVIVRATNGHQTIIKKIQL